MKRVHWQIRPRTGWLALPAAALLAVLWLGCGGDTGTSEETAADTTAGTGARIELGVGSVPILTASGKVIPTYAFINSELDLAAAVFDTTRYQLGPGIMGRRIVSEPGVWAVDYSWFYIPREPIEILTLEEMEKLASSGAIHDTSTIGIASYRVRIPAETIEELTEAANRQRPPEIPMDLARAVRPRGRVDAPN